MSEFNQSQLTILQILGDGTCHSGSELGKTLGVSRTAIWKQINQLIQWGIAIKRVPQQGYQLPSPLILLNASKINGHLQSLNFTQPINLFLFDSIDSTNTYLKKLQQSPTLDVCCAERQTQGRGRFDRHWHSPFGENIYCSVRWNFNCDLASLSGLSLVTSLAIIATINDITGLDDIKIKWPNDILWGDKKLCGSLIEIIAESNGNAQVIIGMGLNVNSDTKNQTTTDYPWCSLFEIFTQQYDRNRIIAELLHHLDTYLSLFIKHKLDYFMQEWHKYDALLGKAITVRQGARVISGIAQGINAQGQLILKETTGTLHYLSSGDTSLKAL